MMKVFLILIAFFSAIEGSCQTQSDLTNSNINAFNLSDHYLNVIYKKILNDYKSNLLFINNLKIAQRLWIQFRDADVKAKYPNIDSKNGGSVIRVCYYSYLKTLTDERIAQLKIWIDGIPEGDACAGSVNHKTN